jgi:signal transduction histidine kinase
MVVPSRVIRAEKHLEIGALIRRDAAVLIARWQARAVDEQPNARRLHHAALLDHLPTFLSELGRSLAAATHEADGWHCPPAREHGTQRWEVGWSLEEVVRDYQLLRLVLLEHLEEALARPLRSREAMAVGLALDEAIAQSTSRYVRHQEETVRQTERERVENEKQAELNRLQREEAALREAHRRKDEFLALLGHELRNPLAPLHNALQVLHLRGADPPTVAWAQEVATRQVQHLTRLADDLLDLSRISRGKILLRQQRVDLGRLVSQVTDDYRRPVETAGLTLTVELPPVSVWVLGDPVRLTQVVSNLLNNAIKFTDPGGTLTVRLAPPDENGRTVVQVQDTGIGIEPDLVPRLFELFMQADRSLERSRGGLGLGLSLARGLVELHGGAMSAASDGPGHGSAFTVWLPVAEGAEAAEETPPLAPLPVPPMRILLVEDNRDAAEALRVLLELWGHQVVVAHTGPVALETARQYRPEVVLCDLGLPGMDGLAVARALRKDPTLSSARLIALTGYGSETDQHQAQKAGFDRHLTKPVDFEELQRILATEVTRPC